MYYVFVTIKILGAFYLIYLGIRSIISARQGMNFSTSQMKAQKISYLNSYRQGLLSTMLNPKALLYYISILPQFLTTGEGVYISGCHIISNCDNCYSAVVYFLCLYFPIY